MHEKKSNRLGICLLAVAAAFLSTTKSTSGQIAAPIRYVFGSNSYTDSKGQVWSPIPAVNLTQSTAWHWSSCAETAVFTGTPDPKLYQQQMAEDGGDLIVNVPVTSGSYSVNLYFAEPCSTWTAGNRVFGVALNGTTIISSLDLTASVGVKKPVIESAQISGTEVTLDLKRSTDDPLIAAIEILPLSASFQVTANLKWDDGTPILGTVVAAQQISTNPPASKSLGSFTLDSAGSLTGSLSPDLTLPLSFSFTLMDPSGTTVNTLGFTCDLATVKVFPSTLNASIVLNKLNGTLKSFSF